MKVSVGDDYFNHAAQPCSAMRSVQMLCVHVNCSENSQTHNNVSSAQTGHKHRYIEYLTFVVNGQPITNERIKRLEKMVVTN